MFILVLCFLLFRPLMLSSLANLNALLLFHVSKNKKLFSAVRQISAIFQTSHTLSVRPVLSHVNLAHHNECLETGDTRSEAKYFGWNVVLLRKKCRVQVPVTVSKLRPA